MTASVPNARRSRSAVGGVRSPARARRAWATWRAVSPTNSITATNTVFSSSTRPCDSLNSEPPSSRYSWTSPLTTVMTIAGPEMRPKPRTAWTRSSSPGPASTTRASRTTPPTHTAIARAWAMPAMTPRIARSPPVRASPSVTTASVGMAIAGSCVVGSMTRSGRSTTQAQATTSTRRASAARPGQPASSRSSQPAGLSPLPNDSPRTAALRATTYSSVPTRVSSHTERRKRTARMYSGPSGQAATISTSDPNSTARPSVDSTRPSQVAPSDTSEASSTMTSSSSTASAVSAGTVVGVVAPARWSPSGSTAVELSTVKLKRSVAPGSPVGWLTCQATLHSPTGIGSVTSTVSVSRSSLSSGTADRRERVALARHLHRVGVAELAVEREHDLRRWLRRAPRRRPAALDERRLLRLGRAHDQQRAGDRGEDREGDSAACGREHRFGRAPPEQGSWTRSRATGTTRRRSGSCRDTPSVSSAEWQRPRCTAATGRAGSPS